LQVHGVDPLTVAQQTGTGLVMIERQNLKFIPHAMREKLASVKESKRQSRKRSPGTSTKEQQLVEAQRLNRWADVLLGIPVGSNLPPKTPMPEFWISDQERSSIAWYLRRARSNTQSIDNDRDPETTARPPPPGEERNYYVALDNKLTNCGWP
jgi:hypothetical protein